jgi:hypothetical protein
MCGSQNIILQGRVRRQECIGSTASSSSWTIISTAFFFIFCFSKTVVLQDCIVRGDLCGVKIGRHCIIGERVVIRPPFKKFQAGLAFFPIHIGDYVVIEDDCVINASTIGSYVHIGKGSVIVWYIGLDVSYYWFLYLAEFFSNFVFKL